VGGGYADTASNSYATIAGGRRNTASGLDAAIVGGMANRASGQYSFVGGGYYHLAPSICSTIPGGCYDTITTNGLNGFATNISTLVDHQNSAAFTTSHTSAANQVRAASFSTGTLDLAMDHPADPMNKILNQYGVSSDEVQSQYSGSAILDGSGRAVVNLPDYFKDINRNPRIQLTGVGTSDVYVTEDITGNRFVIGGKPNTKVYWEVIGERKDIHAEITRIQTPVVQEKTGDLRNHSIDDDAMIGIYDDIKPKNPELFVFKTAEGRRVHEQAKEIAGSK
jgi:hypothetical protein